MIPDDPLIRFAQKYGHSPWESEVQPICPICGQECETVYKDESGNILGCDECLTECDAWEEDECCPWRDE